MKAGIFDPYLDTIGGGERYAMTVAEALLKKGWSVDVFWNNKIIQEKLVNKFNLDIDGVNFVPYSPRVSNLFERRAFELKYDFLFYFSDGSIPFMFGKKNILHFQVPFKNVLKKTLKNTLKLKTIQVVVCNSYFTKKVIDECLKINSSVIYPPVGINLIKPLKKENIILAVGRFSQLLQGKRQDVLVEVFKKMIDGGKLKEWKLILAGGTEVGGREYLEKIKKMAVGYPVEIIENIDFDDLVELYGKAKFFWTASGYGINEEDEPEKVEHFGISTVEAMAAGCVPIVMGKGGQKEIIENGKNGFLWQRKEELEKLTIELIKDLAKLQKISRDAILRSKYFSKKVFYDRFYLLLNDENC